MSGSYGSQDRLDIGRVIGRAGQALAAQPLPFGGLAVILGIGPQVLADLAALDLPFGIGFWMQWSSSAISLFAATLLLVASIAVAAQQMTVGNVDIALALRESMSRILPFAAHMVLWVIAIFIGFAIFTIPGFLLICAFAVSMPALVLERTSITHSFRRSRDLTRGSRWRIFALVLCAILFWVLTMAARDLIPAFGGPAPGFLRSLVDAAFSSVGWIFVAAMTTSLFLELKLVRDGPETDILEEIFS
ncbi:MAG: hypothetical protein WA979_07870 [Pacificimonas sp.]